MITQSNKKIKEQLPPTLHLRLHSPTAHKSAPRPHNQRKVMRAQLRLRIRRVSVREPRTRKYRAALDPGVQALLAQRETLEMREVVFFCCAAVETYVSTHTHIYS